MFRRLPQSLPKDIQVPADLEQLGYFINENDQMRMIQKPDQKYVFRINRNDRVNDVYKEAVNGMSFHRSCYHRQLTCQAVSAILSRVDF